MLKVADLALYAVAALLATPIALLVGWVLFVLHFGTDVAFRSSDGHWGDTEVQVKGRDFENVIVPLFIRYRICAGPEVRLERVTRKPPIYSIDALFNNYDDPKWAVPEAARTGVAVPNGYMGTQPCRVDISWEEIKTESADYISALKSE